jgi:hypothetical protein
LSNWSAQMWFLILISTYFGRGKCQYPIFKQ